MGTGYTATISRRLLLCVGLCVCAASARSSDFSVAEWTVQYGKKIVPKRGWEDLYPLPYKDYFPSRNIENAKNWRIELGPLGITTRMHDRTWAKFSAFKALFPHGRLGGHCIFCS